MSRLPPLLLAACAACTVERPQEPNTNPIVVFRQESGLDFGDCGVLRYTAVDRCPEEREQILACIEEARATCTPVYWIVERSAGGFASANHFFLVPVGDSCGFVTFTVDEEAGCRFFVREDCTTVVMPTGCGQPMPRDCGEPMRLSGAGCTPNEV